MRTAPVADAAMFHGPDFSARQSGRIGVRKMLLFCWLLCLSLFDIRYRRIPVWLLLLGGVVILGSGAYGCIRGENNGTELFLGMIPGVLLLLLAVATKKAGWADGVVLMLLGSMLGFRQCVMGTMVSLAIISVFSAVLLALRRVGKGTNIPYVPFLAMGVMLCKLTGY